MSSDNASLITAKTIFYSQQIQIGGSLELPNQVISGVLYNSNSIYSAQFQWKNTNGTVYYQTLDPKEKFYFQGVSLRTISNTTKTILASSFASPVLNLIYVNGWFNPFDISLHKIQGGQNPNQATLFNAGMTTSTNLGYEPYTNTATLYVHITSVSGTTPSLALSVYAYDTQNDILTGAPLYTKTYTAIGDDIAFINVNQIRNLQIACVVSGTTPVFTMVIGMSG